LPIGYYGHLWLHLGDSSPFVLFPSHLTVSLSVVTVFHQLRNKIPTTHLHDHPSDRTGYTALSDVLSSTTDDRSVPKRWKNQNWGYLPHPGGCSLSLRSLTITIVPYRDGSGAREGGSSYLYVWFLPPQNALNSHPKPLVL